MVSVDQSVTPYSTTFNNSVVSYTLTGTSGIGGFGALSKNGSAGLLTVGNTNSYAGGTYVNGGTLTPMGINNGLPIGGALSLGSSASNGTFNLAGYSQSIGSLGTDPLATAANQAIGNGVASTTSNLTINAASNYGGSIQDGLNGPGGQTALTVTYGLVNLSGSNTYSGSTNIGSGGTLQLGSPTALYAGAAAGNLIANGVLDLSGNTVTVGAISGNGTVTDSSFGASLTFGNAASSTFSGIIQGSSLSLSKTGAGTFVLAGTNNAASTAINQGTFQIGNGIANGAAGLGTYTLANSARLYFNQGASPVTILPWASISGTGTVELNDSAGTGGGGGVAYSQLTLPASTSGTLQVDHRGIVQATPAGLGGMTTVIVNSGAQFLASDGTTLGTSYTYSQNFSIAGLGSSSLGHWVFDRYGGTTR